jgi:hypothetical protein
MKKSYKIWMWWGRVSDQDLGDDQVKAPCPSLSPDSLETRKRLHKTKSNQIKSNQITLSPDSLAGINKPPF